MQKKIQPLLTKLLLSWIWFI